MHNVHQLIRHLAARDGQPLSTDEQLLDGFLTGRDEQAFAAIIGRHGPMVHGVCLRVLGHSQDAEDAFQATFLLLVRKGHMIRRGGSLSMWLHRVAYRLACTQRGRKRRQSVVTLPDQVADPSAHDDGARELRDALDAEVQRLPARYRKVLVLCGLQGKSYDEAAHELGCPKGTVAIRLLRGRALLKRRLAARGLIAATGVAVAAGVPSALASATVSSAVALAGGAALASVAPVAVVALLNAAARDVWVNKCKVVAVVMALLGLTGSGASVAAQVREAVEPPQITTVRPLTPPLAVGSRPDRTNESFPAGVYHTKDGSMIIRWQPAVMTTAPTEPGNQK